MRINMLEALSDNITVDPQKCTTCGTCVERCIIDNLRLKLAPCGQACPLKVNCQGYVQLILRGLEEEALEMVERELPFPAILGRLCSAQCEANCHRKIIDGQAVAIRTLKRYVSDLATDAPSRVPDKATETGKHCAVVGSGPAGMLAAFDLLVKGHAVSMYDAEQEPGGMLRWAIPAFRLPGEVLAAEWAKLTALGVSFFGGQTMGRDISLQQLNDQHDAVIVATGCPRPKHLGIEGEDADGVIHALDLLHQIRDNQRPQMGQNIVVIGGGDVALDAAQTALRLGAERVLTVSLESRDILPASAEALELAEREGVELDGSWGPTRILTKNGRVSDVELQRCLAVFDALGRFAPRFDECSLKTVPADTVIIAIGQEQDPALADEADGCDPMTLRKGDQPIFWAGDVVGGSSTIVEAMASGRWAAESVHRLFSGQHMTYGRAYPGPIETEFEIDTSRGSADGRVSPKWLPFAGSGRFGEVETVLTETEARREAGRCYGCGAPFGKYRTCWFCLPCEVECPHDALWVQIPYLLR
jgi:NADPH-dependent glutamate synthase beta subunit-like oxidoreductase